jgi:hypothetical protein
MTNEWPGKHQDIDLLALNALVWIHLILSCFLVGAGIGVMRYYYDIPAGNCFTTTFDELLKNK